MTGMRAPNFRRRAIGLAVLCGALAILAASATSALADRTYDSQAPFTGVTALAFDANDNVWVSGWFPTLHKPQPGWDNPSAGLYGLDAYPSQTLLDAPITGFEGDIFNAVAVDQSNHDVFLATTNLDAVSIYSKTGFSRYTHTHTWDLLDGHDTGSTVAIDNSHTFSRGRVYLSIPPPQNDVEVVDAAQRPVDFPATASYISGNKLTGTPSGPFGSVLYTAVDRNGDLFVWDPSYNVVDEFASTGIFLRTLPSGGIPATDPTNGNVFTSAYPHTFEYDSSGNLLETLSDGTPVAVNSQGYLYVGNGQIYSPNAVVPAVTYKPATNPTTTSATLNANLDPNGGGDITACHFDYGTDTSYGTSASCSPDPSGAHFSSPTDASAAISGLSADTTYHYRVVVANANGTKYGADQTYTTGKVPGLSTDPATNLTASGATLNASFVGDGTDTTYYFEWGPTTAYANKTAAPPGDDAGSPSGPARTALSKDLTGLNPYSTYHFRVVATNGAGTANGQDQIFTTTPDAPSAQGAAVTGVHSDRAIFHGQVNPNGADTTVHFEYVDDATFQQSGFANATKTSPEIGVGMSKEFASASQLVDGLSPGTLYHYRVVGTNDMGSGNAAKTFRTFPFIPSFADPCPNAHVRQQTGAALLLDCRAYELASASDTGGYDVESNLVPGQTPFGGYPDAQGQVLYGVHNGGIPGTGNPTNNGVDPYVATRGSNGWSTKYVGIPANNPNATGSFSSTVAGADESLNTFAFGGPNICSPCFADGSTGVPVHNPDGSLTQGMAGALDPGPSATTAGTVKKPLSGDGSHLVFGSEQQFEPAANPNNGNATLYSRDLKAATTEVISTDATGTAIADGDKLAELDISNDGQRTVFGDLVSTDSAGNHYYHLYMHVAGNPDSIDLTPGTPDGALYDGMSSDGTMVYFTTADVPTGASDGDTSADIYRADVTASAATLTRVSTGSGGSAGNSDSCTPAANTIRKYWNTVGSTANCDALAVGGGGGVASGDGTIYFLSPELLDGPSNGVAGAPNLYVARPGQDPHFIRTLESNANAPLPPAAHPFLRSFGSFSRPTGIAIDHATGDVYVLDVGKSDFSGTVQKFDSSGHPVKSFANEGTLIVTGSLGADNLPTEVAVDNDPSSPNYGNLYVPNLLGNVVDEYNSSGHHIAQISDNGTQIPTAVAVDPTNGNLYIASFYGRISVYDTSGAHITSFSTIPSPTGVAVDSNGNAYVSNGLFAGPNSMTKKYDSSGKDLGQLTGVPSIGVAVDPSDDHVYVDEGKRVVEFDSAGNPVGAPTGSGLLVNSISLAADSGTLDISNAGKTNVAVFGPAVVPPDPSTDNPVVVDSLSAAGTRNTADFGVSPSGNAVFTSTLPLSGYDNAAHREVFRYDAPSDNLDCASCNPTGEQATGEATLASNGSSLSDDGRVFFNSTEGLVDRDLNGNKDVYEWEKNASNPNGIVELISTGTSPLDSSLLGVSTDGTDAYFFTRDTLVSGDNNGLRVKLYDARAGGGFAQLPPVIQCQASDECHGAGSPTPPPPDIKTIAGTPVGNATQAPHRRKHHHKRHHHKRAHHKRGGVK
jgi:hypothetical protein